MLGTDVIARVQFVFPLCFGKILLNQCGFAHTAWAIDDECSARLEILFKIGIVAGNDHVSTILKSTNFVKFMDFSSINFRPTI